MPSKNRLATGRMPALECSALVEVEYTRKPIWCSNCHLLGHSKPHCRSQEAFRDIVFSPTNVEGLQGYDVSAGVNSISYADISKHGSHSKEVDERGTCGAHQLPNTDVDRLGVLGGSFYHEGNVGSHALGFALSSLEFFPETE
ncbi:hypothetical protein Nepgr_019538 [Nepenthes gracilis]|uniref:Uncharacterized protein n=1 Tax=Nepenthes gracilis TaxID=150966 RepID=A0AAD3XU81_NEPGR|nr:hypothetical protein Nepgr_019538 [Nepenthes gracilis]